MIGTAQISALLTLAETNGKAKTVATPRVTALNNRPAQIESGSQIPVQTTQAAGGTAVVTTTFVSVPLRLSITPQITDVGTVILRVTIENNTLNTGIAVGGVPGIDTQRMQSEVLVQDRTVTVPQPVPLGNPQTNTPTPTQLQQQQNQPQPQNPPLNPAPNVPGPSTPTARPGTLGGTRP